MKEVKVMIYGPEECDDELITEAIKVVEGKEKLIELRELTRE